MPSQIPSRIAGALLPDTVITWVEDDVNINPSGYTWTVECSTIGSTTALWTKSTGFTMTSTTLTIAWALTDLGTLTRGTYVLELSGTANSKSRKYHLKLQIEDQLA